MKKRILIIYATYGSGHKSVANYIYNYFKKYDSYDIYFMNIMDYANKVGKMSEKLFEFNIHHQCSIIFSCLYELFNNKVTTIPYKKVFNYLFNQEILLNEIKKINPDMVIATHFFGVTLTSLCNNKGITNSKIISILTDYCSHELIEKDKDNVDYYIVANKIIKNILISHKIERNKIYPYGIPISNEFEKKTDISYLKKKYNIDTNKKTILFFSGGSLGSNTSYNYLKQLLKNRYDINIIFVSGKNEKLRKKCLNLVKNNKYLNVCILGFTNYVNELLLISDIVITKPGGISITECLKMKKKMILISGNGGQEIFNARFVCKNKFGVYARNSKKLNKCIRRFLNGNYDYMDNKLINNSSNKAIKKLYKLVDKNLRR